MMSSIGYRLKQKRLELGLTQYSIARVAGVTSASISKWESNGGVTMSAIAALKIAEFLNVNPFWLIMGQGEPSDKRIFPQFSANTEHLACKINRLSEPKRDVIQQVIDVMGV